MTFRLKAGYPPFTRLVRFIIRDRNQIKAESRARALYDLIRNRTQYVRAEVDLIGPAQAFVARIDGVYQWHLVAKDNSTGSSKSSRTTS